VAENILVVEDEPITRCQLAQTLSNKGYHVTEAADGAEAIELLSKQHFNLIISDLMLPKLHGLHLVNLISSQWPQIPVIVVSGFLPEIRGKTSLQGLADYISKPVDPDILLARVRHYLRYHLPQLSG
jgi:DNA-binding response OmpR family regulator